MILTSITIKEVQDRIYVSNKNTAIVIGFIHLFSEDKNYTFRCDGFTILTEIQLMEIREVLLKLNNK